MSEQSNQSSNTDRRLDALESQLRETQLLYEMQFGNDKISGAMVSLLTKMSEDVRDVKLALFGEAKDGSVGLLVRLDRLEQWSKTARWAIGVLFVAGVGELAYIIFRG